MGKKTGNMDQGAQINQIEYITCIANLIPETIKIVDNVKILSFVNFFNYLCHFSFFCSYWDKAKNWKNLLDTF